jgi:hypothetical protein
MEIYGKALATQGFESPRLQTSPRRLRLREATSGKPQIVCPVTPTPFSVSLRTHSSHSWKIEYTAAATRTACDAFTAHRTSNLSGMRHSFFDRGDRCRHSCRNRRPTILERGAVQRKSQVGY